MVRKVVQREEGTPPKAPPQEAMAPDTKRELRGLDYGAQMQALSTQPVQRQEGDKPQSVLAGPAPRLPMGGPGGLTRLPPHLMPRMDFSWMDKADDWLTKHQLDVTLNKLDHIARRMRQEVPELKDKSEYDLIVHVQRWAKTNRVGLTDKSFAPGSVGSAMGAFFSELSKFGSFDWSFGAGNLNLNLKGQTATLGFKDGQGEASLEAGTKGVTAKAAGTSKDGVRSSLEGNVNYDGSGGAKASVGGGPVTVSGGIKVDAEGKVSGSASLNIADVIRFAGKSGNVGISFSGDASSWKFGLELSTSGGKEAHLSRTAAAELRTTMYAAAAALREIYGVLKEEELTLKNADAIKDRVKPHWESVDAAIKALSAVSKKPTTGPEVFVSFGLSGSTKPGEAGSSPAATLGLTLRF